MSETGQKIDIFIQQKQAKLKLTAPTGVDGLFKSIWKSLKVEKNEFEDHFSIYYLDKDRFEWEILDEPTY